MNIYVGNIFFGMEESELEAMFAEYGTVTSARIIFDRETGRSRGFGFVEMSNDDEAKKAIAELNDKEVSGRNLSINEARPKQERTPRRDSRY